jgi:RNA polymerase sigma factor (TIGR02999 family)
MAARAMRRILIDHARQHRAVRRGGGQQRPVSLSEVEIVVDQQAETLIMLDAALTRLATLNERLSCVVECRFFGGLTDQETAEALAVNERTVRRDWVKARAWLQRELNASVPDIGPE